MSGNVRREEPNKPSYATNIEDIWHWYWIHNANASPVYFGVLGLNVVKDPSYNFFHTSWDGKGAPNGLLSIDGGCFGLNGYVCSPDDASAQLRDQVHVSQPGHYQMTLAICQSSFLACSQPGGAWQELSTVTFDAIDWTPTPPAQFQATPAPAERCQLITNDPRGTYLRCTKAQMRHRYQAR